jgi:hypothetical protein
MSCETSRGKACVRQLCKAFKVSPQAYYHNRQRPLREAEERRTGRALGRVLWSSRWALSGLLRVISQEDLGGDEGQGVGVAPDSGGSGECSRGAGGGGRLQQEMGEGSHYGLDA